MSLVALLLAGLMTFLSPCVLPLIPVYLAMLFTDRQGVEVGEQPEETLVQTLEVLAGQACDGFHRLGSVSSPGS